MQLYTTGIWNKLEPVPRHLPVLRMADTLKSFQPQTVAILIYTSGA